MPCPRDTSRTLNRPGIKAQGGPRGYRHNAARSPRNPVQPASVGPDHGNGSPKRAPGRCRDCSRLGGKIREARSIEGIYRPVTSGSLALCLDNSSPDCCCNAALWTSVRNCCRKVNFPANDTEVLATIERGRRNGGVLARASKRVSHCSMALEDCSHPRRLESACGCRVGIW